MLFLLTLFLPAKGTLPLADFLREELNPVPSVCGWVWDDETGTSFENHGLTWPSAMFALGVFALSVMLQPRGRALMLPSTSWNLALRASPFLCLVDAADSIFSVAAALSGVSIGSPGEEDGYTGIGRVYRFLLDKYPMDDSVTSGGGRSRLDRLRWFAWFLIATSVLGQAFKLFECYGAPVVKALAAVYILGFIVNAFLVFVAHGCAVDMTPAWARLADDKKAAAARRSILPQDEPQRPRLNKRTVALRIAILIDFYFVLLTLAAACARLILNDPYDDLKARVTHSKAHMTPFHRSKRFYTMITAGTLSCISYALWSRSKSSSSSPSSPHLPTTTIKPTSKNPNNPNINNEAAAPPPGSGSTHHLLSRLPLPLLLLSLSMPTAHYLSHSLALNLLFHPAVFLLLAIPVEFIIRRGMDADPFAGLRGTAVVKACYVLFVVAALVVQPRGWSWEWREWAWRGDVVVPEGRVTY